jgi:hypothetical protein
MVAMDGLVSVTNRQSDTNRTVRHGVVRRISTSCEKLALQLSAKYWYRAGLTSLVWTGTLYQSGIVSQQLSKAGISLDGVVEGYRRLDGEFFVILLLWVSEGFGYCPSLWGF